MTMSEEKSLNFIEEIIEEDLKSGKYKSIVTRFPPEPNGYLHIGHAKSICLNFGLAQEYASKFSASVMLRVKMISSRDGALRNAATLSRAPS